jgi:uncharacterized membrane protein YhaH (DUF805 family)
VLYSWAVTEGSTEQARDSGGRSRRAAVWLVWFLYGLMTCLVIVASGAQLLNSDGPNDALRLAGDALITVATPLVFAAVAALIVSRQPRNTIGWLLTVVVGAYLVGEPLENYVDGVASSPTPTLPLLLAVWFSNWGWLLLIFSLLLILLLFPTTPGGAVCHLMVTQSRGGIKANPSARTSTSFPMLKRHGRVASR